MLLPLSEYESLFAKPSRIEFRSHRSFHTDRIGERAQCREEERERERRCEEREGVEEKRRGEERQLERGCCGLGNVGESRSSTWSEQHACAAARSAAHLSVSPGRAPTAASSARISLCVRAFTIPRMPSTRATFETGEPEPRLEGDRMMRVSTQRARMKARVFSGKGQRYRPRKRDVPSEGRSLPTSFDSTWISLHRLTSLLRINDYILG